MSNSSELTPIGGDTTALDDWERDTSHIAYIEERTRALNPKKTGNGASKKYSDQSDIADQICPSHLQSNGRRVRLIVERQTLRKPYANREKGDAWQGGWNNTSDEGIRYPAAIAQSYIVRQVTQETKTELIGRQVLMRYSSLAQEHFTFNSKAHTLNLPARYPRDNKQAFEGGGYRAPHMCSNVHTAYIDPKTVTSIVFPWFQEAERLLKEEPTESPPPFGIPESLDGAINLYNVLLQLGMHDYLIRPIATHIIHEMHRLPLLECELLLVEHTVARFYARGLPILDPVINHLVGTYHSRTLTDKQSVHALISYTPQTTDRNNKDLPGKFLPDDIHPVPPEECPVLAHCFRHWSGVKLPEAADWTEEEEEKSTRNATEGFPLNVGVMYYEHRRGYPSETAEPVLLQRERVVNLGAGHGQP
ncbi:hypothetical protein BCR34DRAFT_593946 [Clohesyomyces aquaticus]|uniref:Uncharacterized protein n=1 Tax=Clohesyomyces aquaticus TaxID=1231657 RepID=A0A1Y1YDP9_9PLEO|nr:hypothetical protein BCR34DRAFT_593946 [Clohesyomyces aquaticus]